MSKLAKRPYAREDESLDQYLQEIGEVNLLTAAEEITLAKRIKKGDQDALERLTKANLRFVVSVAKQYQNQGLSMGDLINEGNLGLIKAAKRFDETKGFKFISYAVWWIRQAILKSLVERGRIARPPMSQITDLQRVEKERGLLAQQLGRAPTFEEIAARVDLSFERTRDAFSLCC